MTVRDELNIDNIAKIIEYHFLDATEKRNTWCKNAAVDIMGFILADRKRIIEEIMNLYSSDEWKGLNTLRKMRENA